MARLRVAMVNKVYPPSTFHSPYPWGEIVALGAARRAPFVVTFYHDVVRQKVLNKLCQPVQEPALRACLAHRGVVA